MDNNYTETKMKDPKYDLSRLSYGKKILILFILFFKLGIVNFGGGYALLPLLTRELCDKRGWATEEELANYYAVGQCTPGAIAVNVSTFIGYKIGGMLGGIVATLGFVTPAFLIIFIIATLLTNFSENPFVKNAIAGVNVVVVVLILSAIIKLSKKSITDKYGVILATVVALMAIIFNVIPLYAYVIFAAIYGIIISYLKEKKESKNVSNITPKDINLDEKEYYDNNNLEEDIVKDYQQVDNKSTVLVKDDTIKVTSKEEKKKNILSFIAGFIVGILLGIIGYISFIFVKNKKYREGLIATSVLWLIMLACTLVLIFTHSSVYFEVYFNFFRIGFCAFGGGLATFPFLQELGVTTGWFTANELSTMLAVSESTPGAMGINMSTYVGYNVCFDLDAFGNVNIVMKYILSFVGSMISTLGLVTPSIIVIIIVSLFLEKFNNNKYVKWIFYGLRAASIGLIIKAGYSVFEEAIFINYNNEPNTICNGIFNNLKIIQVFNQVSNMEGLSFFGAIGKYFEKLIDFKCLAFMAIMIILVFKFKKHPVLYIAIGALCGIIFQIGNVSL